MQTGSLSKLNIPLGFGLRKGIRLQSQSQFQQRSVFCKADIRGRLSFKPGKTLIPRSDCEFGNLRKDYPVAGVIQFHSCIFVSRFSTAQAFEHTRNPCFIKAMATSGSVATSGDLIVNNFISSCGNVSNFGRPTGRFVERNRSFHVASVGMKNREPTKSHGVHGYFIFGITHTASNIYTFGGQLRRRCITSSSTCYPDGGVPDGVLKESSHDGTIASLAIEADGKSTCGRTLKLLSGSSYLPHPDKEATGGEDAHFICMDEQVIGVADGVGGWADVGINAGEYSRSLMSNSVRAVQEEPKAGIDPAKVLAKAHLATNAKGSSTACIIALRDQQGLHAINLGDSGFVVIRDGCTVFQSPVQQHSFNFTYQLANGNEGDHPSSGQVFNIPVLPGDVIVAGTDGLFDNLYNNEVTALVVRGVRSRLSPEAMAKNIAALARQKALDRKRQSPFSTAAQEAGFRYHGGKLDDITVVVSFIVGSTDE